MNRVEDVLRQNLGGYADEHGYNLDPKVMDEVAEACSERYAAHMKSPPVRGR